MREEAGRCDLGLLRCESLEFAKFDEADTGDGFDLAQGFDGCGCGGGTGDVDLHDRDGLALGDALGAGRCSAARPRAKLAMLTPARRGWCRYGRLRRDVVVADGDEVPVSGASMSMPS